MSRIKVDDINAYGAQNAVKLQKALTEPVDPRLTVLPPDVTNSHETVVQAQTIGELRQRGYRVLEASVRYRLMRCPSCEHCFRSHADTGQSPGIPDLFVRSDAWPVAVWLGVEMKGAKTRLSPAQVELLAALGIEVARTPAQAWEIVQRADSILKGPEG